LIFDPPCLTALVLLALNLTGLTKPVRRSPVLAFLAPGSLVP